VESGITRWYRKSGSDRAGVSISQTRQIHARTLRHNQQDALCTLRPALGDYQTGLNRLSEANLVRENATAFAQTAKGENYRVNLVGIWVNARLALRRRIALPVVGAADPYELLGEKPLVEGMHIGSCVSLNSILRSVVPFSRFCHQYLGDVSSRNFHSLQQPRFSIDSASALNHPNICTVYDIGECEGETFCI
jgi:hypothetical protein